MAAPSPMLMPRTLGAGSVPPRPLPGTSHRDLASACISVITESEHGVLVVSGALHIVSPMDGSEWISSAVESWSWSVSTGEGACANSAIQAIREHMVELVLQRLCQQVSWFSTHIFPASVSIIVPEYLPAVATPLLRRAVNAGFVTADLQLRTGADARNRGEQWRPHAELAVALQNRETRPVVIATDASKKDRYASAAWVNGYWEYGCRELVSNSILEAEILAICCALQSHLRGRNRHRRCLILSDSKPALRFFAGTGSGGELHGSDLALALQARQWASSPNVELRWVKGHSGHLLNEVADRLASNRNRSRKWKFSEEEIWEQERRIIYDRRTRRPVNKRFAKENVDSTRRRYGRLLFDSARPWARLQEQLSELCSTYSVELVNHSQVDANSQVDAITPATRTAVQLAA